MRIEYRKDGIAYSLPYELAEIKIVDMGEEYLAEATMPSGHVYIIWRAETKDKAIEFLNTLYNWSEDHPKGAVWIGDEGEIENKSCN